jgi:hypothetical protein
MAVRPLSAAMPQAPFVDQTTGEITLVWRMFLTQLWTRTGGGPGVDSTNPALTAALAVEVQRRQAGDASLTAAIGAETGRAQSAEQVLADAIRAEMAMRAGDDILGNQHAQNLVDAETAARKAADALLVPIAQLCSLWAQCNLAFLPVADPGHGMPWLNVGVVTVGSPPTYLGLETGVPADDWSTEAAGIGSGNWQWG